MSIIRVLSISAGETDLVERPSAGVISTTVSATVINVSDYTSSVVVLIDETESAAISLSEATQKIATAMGVKPCEVEWPCGEDYAKTALSNAEDGLAEMRDKDNYCDQYK